jgi:trans-aconitate methyltransferase
MANEKQFKVKTKFIATRGVKEYRATIPQWVNEDDVVLEIGCEWGTTTAMIAPHCKEIIGTDVSAECIERAKERHPGIRFEVLDGFDVRAALEFGIDFTKVYIDMSGLSGYRSLLDGISLLTMYATVLRPDAIIIKSGALKHFAANCVPWRPPA